MFEAIKATGELWRPTRANHTGRCACCDGRVVAIPSGRLHGFRWSHDCTGPSDGWHDTMSALLGDCGFARHDGYGHSSGKACILLAEGWRSTPADDVEMDVAAAGMVPLWLVDARDVSVAFGGGLPGAEYPSWTMGAAWSEFVTTWLLRTSAQVVLHLRNAASGYPDNATDAVYFVVGQPMTESVKPRGGALAGVTATGANGRATTLRDVVLVAKRLGVAGGVPDFSTQPPHTLDLPAWVFHDGAAPQAQDRTFAAHQRRMAARRSH